MRATERLLQRRRAEGVGGVEARIVRGCGGGGVDGRGGGGDARGVVRGGVGVPRGEVPHREDVPQVTFCSALPLA